MPAICVTYAAEMLSGRTDCR